MQLDPDRVRRALVVGRCASPEEVARRLVALHATDPTTLALSTWARLPDGRVPDASGALSRALEDDRALVRILAMRRTLHVVPVDLVPALVAVYRERLGPAQRKLAGQLLELSGARASLEDIAARVVDALGDGDATVTELAATVPELAGKFTYAEGKAYGGTTTIGSRMMDALGTLGHVVRARAQGGWKTSQCSWSRLERWLPDLAVPSPAEGRTVVVRAYLSAFGPATLADVAWWTGLPKAQVRAALGEDVVEVEVRGWPGVRLARRDRLDDLDRRRPEAPITFLPALDPSLMGHQDRTPFMDPAHRPALFDRSGNVGATVQADGRVVGAWASRKDGSIAVRMLERPELEADVAREARRIEEALGGVRVLPRFPVPLGKALASS